MYNRVCSMIIFFWLHLPRRGVAGADYAEARLEDTLTDTIRTRNGAVERLRQRIRDAGWGIHAMAGGGWGFASTSLTGPTHS